MYIHNTQLSAIKNLPQNSTRKNKASLNNLPTGVSRTEISNICYKPIFTSGKESPDNDFWERRRKVKNFLKMYLKEHGYDNYKELTNEALSVLNKDNVKLVSKYLRQNTVDTYLLDSLKHFKAVTKDNMPVVEYLLLDGKKNFKKRISEEDAEFIRGVNAGNIELVQKLLKDEESQAYQKKIIDVLNVDNLEIADYLIDNNYRNVRSGGFLDDVLNRYSKDKVAAFSLICASSLYEDLSYPAEILKIFPELLNEKDSNFMKKLYKYCKNNKLDNVISKINSGNISFAKEQFSYKDNASIFDMNRIKPILNPYLLGNILANTTPENEKVFIRPLLNLVQRKESPISQNMFSQLVGIAKDLNQSQLNRFKNLDESLLENLNDLYSSMADDYFDYVLKKDFVKAFDQLERLKNAVNAHLELYVDDEEEEELNEDYYQHKVKVFFEKNKDLLILASCLLDKEALDNLMRRRLSEAEIYLNILEDDLDFEQYDLLYRFNNACNASGKPFLPAQKVEFIDLIKAYNDNNIPTDKIEKMLENGKVDISELHFDLLKALFVNNNIYSNEELAKISKEKLMQWDLRYIHLLSTHFNDDGEAELFGQVFDLANNGNFKENIFKDDTYYGKTNQAIKNEFSKFGYDFDNWFNPKADLNIQTIIENPSIKELDAAAIELEKNIELLRKTFAGVFVDKQLKKYIIDNKFLVPKNIRMSQPMLLKFNQAVVKQLDSVWKKAELNLEDPTKSSSARYTLAIKDSLLNNEMTIEDIKNDKNKRSIDITVKMWDRIPQKDLFQGNYTGCCIGVGACNAISHPVYLMNTTFNMIEVIDNKNGDVIGNALCYLTHIDGEAKRPAFIVDNIEIKDSLSKDPKFRKKIRNAIAAYAKNVGQAVTNDKNIPIYLGGEDNNDVPIKHLREDTQVFSVVGDALCNFDENIESVVSDDEYVIYLDLFGGWCNKDILKKYCKVYIIG